MPEPARPRCAIPRCTAPCVALEMPAASYFKYAAALMKTNPPHATDWSTVARLKRIGIEPGKFDFGSLPPATQAGLNRATGDALKLMFSKSSSLARVANGWQMNTDTMGVYGDYYLKRAIIAMIWPPLP